MKLISSTFGFLIYRRCCDKFCIWQTTASTPNFERFRQSILPLSLHQSSNQSLHHTAWFYEDIDVPNVCSITMQMFLHLSQRRFTYIQEPPARLPQGVLQMVKCDCRNCPSEICKKVLEPEKEIYWRMKQHHCYKQETPDHIHTHTHTHTHTKGRRRKLVSACFWATEHRNGSRKKVCIKRKKNEIKIRDKLADASAHQTSKK